VPGEGGAYVLADLVGLGPIAGPIQASRRSGATRRAWIVLSSTPAARPRQPAVRADADHGARLVREQHRHAVGDLHDADHAAAGG